MATDLLERHLGAVAHAHALAQDVGLEGEQLVEQLVEVVHQQLVVHRLGRGRGAGVLHGVEEGEVGVAVEALVEADGGLDQRDAHAGEALGADAAGLGELGLGGGAAVAGLELAPGAEDLAVGVDHVDGEPDGAALVGDRPGHGVTDPPAAVGREATALARVEAVDRLHQAEVALLDQVLQRHAAAAVAAGDGDDQAQVGLHELGAGAPEGLVLATHGVHVGQEGQAAARRELDLHAEAAVLAGLDADQVGEHAVGDEVVDVGLGERVGQGLAAALVLLAVDEEVAVPQLASGDDHRVQGGARAAGGGQHLAAELADAGDEGRVAERGAPERPAKLVDATREQTLLLAAHHLGAGDVTEVHRQRSRDLVVAAAGRVRVSLGAGVRRAVIHGRLRRRRRGIVGQVCCVHLGRLRKCVVELRRRGPTARLGLRLLGPHASVKALPRATLFPRLAGATQQPNLRGLRTSVCGAFGRFWVCCPQFVWVKNLQS